MSERTNTQGGSGAREWRGPGAETTRTTCDCGDCENVPTIPGANGTFCGTCSRGACFYGKGHGGVQGRSTGEMKGFTPHSPWDKDTYFGGPAYGLSLAPSRPQGGLSGPPAASESQTSAGPQGGMSQAPATAPPADSGETVTVTGSNWSTTDADGNPIRLPGVNGGNGKLWSEGDTLLFGPPPEVTKKYQW